VLVNAVALGFVSTRMSVVDGKDELESDWFKEVYLRHGKLPIRRHAMPPEIAEHVAWLASERNTYVTGQVLTVDGGLTVTL
jgi:NAD(P)-dependent dehydrogenase (short-subunit alcohol dehydrogenase family)